MKLQKTTPQFANATTSTSSSIARTFNGVRKKNFKAKKTNNNYNNTKTNGETVDKLKSEWKNTKKTVINVKKEEKNKKTNNNNNYNDKTNDKIVHKLKSKWKKTKKKKKKKTVTDVNEMRKNHVANKDRQNHISTEQGTESVEVRRFHVPTDPAECSSNWKQLCTSMISSNCEEGTNTDKKKKKKMKSSLIPDSQLKVSGVHGSVLLNGKRNTQKVQKNGENTKAGKTQDKSTTEKSGPWFDDVDEALIEPTTSCEDPVESEMKLVESTASDKLTTCVALDCEMVGTGELGDCDMLARVSVVNQYGHCLYDRYVQPMEEITDYRTRFSGVTPYLLKDATNFKTVQKDVGKLLKDRILVGHALHNDFKVLYLNHPKEMIRDTTKYAPFRKLGHSLTPSLKMLAKDVIGVTIQHGSHSSVIDAQVAMQLYMQHRKDWEKRLKHKRKKLKGKKKVKKIKGAQKGNKK